jgi:hypothetical protein
MHHQLKYSQSKTRSYSLQYVLKESALVKALIIVLDQFHVFSQLTLNHEDNTLRETPIILRVTL